MAEYIAKVILVCQIAGRSTYSKLHNEYTNRRRKFVAVRCFVGRPRPSRVACVSQLCTHDHARLYRLVAIAARHKPLLEAQAAALKIAKALEDVGGYPHTHTHTHTQIGVQAFPVCGMPACEAAALKGDEVAGTVGVTRTHTHTTNQPTNNQPTNQASHE
jgi:hypothetical protein